MKTTRKDLAKLAAELADDPLVEQEVKEQIEHSQFVRMLTQFRIAKGMSQADIARAMDCDPSKVSRLENGEDHDLAWKDILLYLNATRTGMNVIFHDQDASLEERTKQLVFAIHQNLEQLADIARSQDGDDEAVEKIHQFCGEVLFNFLIRFDQSYKKIQQVRPSALTDMKPQQLKV